MQHLKTLLRIPAIVLFVAASTALASDEAAIKAINDQVVLLDKRISGKDLSLPALKVEYDFYEPTEGVPPSFTFYFETTRLNAKTHRILRACKTHVGREVFANEYIYYFDSEGHPLKYLFTDSGVKGVTPGHREAVIYDKDGKVTWKSGELKAPDPSFKNIVGLFKSLDQALGKF